MNWEAAGAIGEIVGAMGVFASLGYLALQIRHSNAQARVEAVRVSTEHWVAQHQAAFSTEQNVSFMRRAMSNFETLSQDEQGRFFGVMTGYIAAFDSLYTQHKAGLLPDDVFAALETAFLSIVLTPGMQGFMAKLDDRLLPPYINEYINGNLGPDKAPLLMSDMEFFKLEGDT